MWMSATDSPQGEEINRFGKCRLRHRRMSNTDPHLGVRVLPCSRINRSNGLAQARASNTECREADVETIECKRCGPDKPKLARPPFRTELGTSIQEQICSECWADWLQHQTLLINHYGLDPREAKAKEFLYGQIETVLLEGGEGKQVDTSQHGEIEW